MMVSFLILTGVALQILLQLPASDGREASASGLVLYAVIATASGLLSFPFIWLLTRHMPKRFALPLLNLCILGVYLALLAFGRTVYNTRAWIYIGSFSLQLTEIAKFLTLTAFALEFTNEDVSPDRRLVHALGTLALNGLFLVAVNELGTLCVLLSAFIFLAFLYLPSIGRVFQTMAVIALNVCVAISCCRVCYECAQRKAEVQEQVGVVTAQGARIYAKFKLRADLILRPESVSRNDGGYQSARAEKALLLSDWLGSSYEVSIPVVESDYIFDYALLKMGVIFGVLTLLMMLCLFLNATLSCLKNPCQSEAAAGVVYAFAISFQSILAAASATGMFFTVGLPFAFLASGGSSTLVNYTMIVFVIFAARRFSQPRHATDAPTREPLRRKRKEPIL